MRFASLPTRALLLSVAAFCVGCGEDNTPKTEQASVSGSVTVDGTPITLDSTVTFISENEGANAGGMIDALGNYNIKAGVPKIGIPVGRYKVMIRPPTPVTQTAAVGSDDYKKMMAQPVGAKAAGKGADAGKEIPMEFQSLSTTPIVLELQPGPNKLDFDLAKLSKKK